MIAAGLRAPRHRNGFATTPGGCLPAPRRQGSCLAAASASGHLERRRAMTAASLPGTACAPPFLISVPGRTG